MQEKHGTGRDDPGWFHPSALGDSCDAKLAFRYLGAPASEIIPARTQRIFDNGSGRDYYLKKDMAAAGVSLIKKEEDRKILIPNLHIRGELDEFVQNPLTKVKYVVDFKTMHSKEWTELQAVKPGHHIQMLPYEFAKNVSNGFVLYENKDSNELKALVADFDRKLWQEKIVDRIERILEGLDKGYVNRTPVNCSSCPFFNNGVCTSNQIELLKEESKLYV